MKGFIEDSFVMLFLMFVLAILFIVMAFAMNQVPTTGTAMDSVTPMATQAFRSFNSLAPLWVIGSGIVLIASAALIRTVPALFFIFMIIQLIQAYVAISMSNVYFAMFSTGPIGAEAANNFGLWTIVFQYFPIISIVLAIIFAIVVFAKGE